MDVLQQRVIGAVASFSILRQPDWVSAVLFSLAFVIWLLGLLLC
ncbi:hypothetical protein SA3033_03405 [Aggregatibacter actinomycetemcomitans serotype d str. SA3033]|nr:hypothetical protein [Aggregatibacter actinomycetemcomitans]KYK96209.1 hypothetical protein SA3733_02995 [Aggregatibacter actinomycetemcomitans serotype d str. SA3733]EKX92920.1 hypothetical protein HMPREF9996_02356 [Aggregatibacter actinomycetemcomitans Y4]KYK77187.1 hypothetical protein SA2876_06280 [Aggregatibacter actinomycetemcomitans serotype e str. SA2876]KYK84384.1 hypothetical protein SA3033_03405 [Aggregatibacter actinomycetemcomitans serotype d str. SA3033]KYK87401.1 hypothetical